MTTQISDASRQYTRKALHLVRLTRNLRKAQRDFFETRGGQALRRAKRLESAVDALLLELQQLESAVTDAAWKMLHGECGAQRSLFEEP